MRTRLRQLQTALTQQKEQVVAEQLWADYLAAVEATSIAKLDDQRDPEQRYELSEEGQARAREESALERVAERIVTGSPAEQEYPARAWAKQLVANPRDVAFLLSDFLSWTGYAEGDAVPREIITRNGVYHYPVRRGWLRTRCACGRRLRPDKARAMAEEELLVATPGLRIGKLRPLDERACRECQTAVGIPETTLLTESNFILIEDGVASALTARIPQELIRLRKNGKTWRWAVGQITGHTVYDCLYDGIYRLVWADWQANGDGQLIKLLGKRAASELTKRLPEDTYRLVDVLDEEDWLDLCRLYRGDPEEAEDEFAWAARERRQLWPQILHQRLRYRLGLRATGASEANFLARGERDARGRRITYQESQR